MVRNRSGPITSTTWPISRSSSTTVVSVRTTPFVCGRHASVTISSRCEGAGGSIASQPILLSRVIVSGRCAQRRSARCEERQIIGSRPVDQLEPPIMMLHQRRAAFHPVAVIDVEHALHLAHFCMVDVAAHNAVETAAARFIGKRALESIDRLYRPLPLAFEPGGQRPVGITEAATQRVKPAVENQRDGVGAVA